MRRLWMIGPSQRRALYSVLGGVLFFFAGSHFFCPSTQRNMQPKTETLSSRERVESAECTRWKSSDEILSQSQPQIKLNSQKFLLPLLYNGPTNQLWGFRQASYLAMILNRTLVLPVFRKHATDDSGPNSRIDPSHRFQVEAFANLVSVTSLQTYLQECGDSVETIFLATKVLKWAIPSLRLAERELEIKFLQHPRKGDIKPSDSFRHNIKVFSSMAHDADRVSIMDHYNSDAKCVLYALPFREINMEINRNSWHEEYEVFSSKFSTSLAEVPDWSIVHAIHLNTGSPKYVQEITRNFLELVFNKKPFLSLHWRYDLEDFYKFMCNKEEGKGNPNQAEMCKKVAKVTPENLGNVVADYIRHVNEVAMITISDIYIATPRTPSATNFVGKLSTILSRFQITAFTQYDLEEYVRRTGLFGVCRFLEKNINEFLSLSEMEICTESTVFLRSTYSSWSDTITLNRLTCKKSAARKFDKSLFHLLQNKQS